MLDLGTVRPGTTLYIPFHTFDSNDPSASVTISGLATTDIEVYKNGSNTARASDSGYALLGTDGIDEFGTGVHGFSIDLADNTTSGFYAAGAQYFVVIASITVDAATVNFVAATFRIGYPDALFNTTVTVTSQTSVTLAVGPAEANALVGCPIILHDVASAVQMSPSVITAYAATTRVATIVAPTFTVATGDNIAVYPPSNTRWAGAVAWGSGAITAGSIASSAITSSKIASGAITAAGIASSAITAAKIATDAITADKIAADAIGASELATDAVNEIADAVWDEAQADHTSAGSFGEVATEVASILVDTAEIGAAGAGLSAIPWNAAWDAEVQSECNDALVAIGLDHLVSASVTGTDVVDNSIFAKLVSASATADWDDYLNTSYSLHALRDRGDAAWITGTAGLTPLATGTAQGGTSTTIQLASGHTFADDELNGNMVYIHTGTGAGQSRTITDYTGATDTATIQPAWTTTPSTDSEYEVIGGNVNTAAIELLDPTNAIVASCNASIESYHLDHLLAVDYDPASPPGVATALLNELVESDGGVSRLTWNPAWDAEVQSEVQDALDTAIPTPTAGSAWDVLNDLSAVLPSSGTISTLTAANINTEVLDVLNTDTFAEPSSVPAATASLVDKIGWMQALARNRTTSTATTLTLRNDGDAADIGTSTQSDDATTYTRGKWS